MKCQFFSYEKERGIQDAGNRNGSSGFLKHKLGVTYQVLKVSILFASVTPLSLIYSNKYKWMAGIYLQSILQ